MEAMVARVIHQLKPRSIPYFQPVADTPGLARAVARTISELRLNGVPPEKLSEAGLPGGDLARMTRLFEQELADRSAADFASVVEHAIRVAREGRHRLLGLPVVLLDIDADSRRMADLLEAVLAQAPAAFDARMVPAAGSRGGTTLDWVRRSLFAEAALPATDADETLAYFSAAGDSLECVEMARRIRALAAEGVAFDRIAILLRSPERYQPLVEEALHRAEIPPYFSRGVARPHPAGRAFLALLACAREGCSATRFAEYLSLGQAPRLDHAAAAEPASPPDDEVLARLYQGAGTEPTPEVEQAPPENQDDAVVGGTLQSPAAWEKLLVDAAVIGGPSRWERRLRGLEQEYRTRLADLGQKEEGRRPHLLREIARLKNLERFALPLIARLAALPRSASWGDWIAHLRDLAGAALRQPGAVLALLDELQAMDEIGPVGLDEISGVLRERLRFLRREPSPRRYGQVFVGGIAEARGRVFDVVFLPGLCEGLFPSRPREDPILLDVYRDMLAAGLRVQNDRVDDERRLLHIACAAARRRLVFSYPRVDAVESRPRVPSFYALELVRAAYGRLPDLRTFEEDARRGAPSRLDWPAPADPREAIDDAEYDLATLGRAHELPAAETGGLGHYLLDANPYLAASLRRHGRRHRRAWFAEDGIVNPDAATRAVLAAQRLDQRSFSPSALQHFAACPYRFLLNAVHRFRPREESVALEQMDPLTRGALFHEAQFKIFAALRDARLLPMRQADLPRILPIADDVLQSVADQNEEKLAPAIQRVWRSEIDDLRGDLHGWIEHAAADSGWLPLHFEFGFGVAADETRDPQSTAREAVLEDGVRLRGAIDLIEKHEIRGTLRVTDHKTGKVPQPEPAYVGGGAFLQPLAYAFAAETLLGIPTELSRLSYCTQRGGYREIPFPISPAKRTFFKRAMQLIDGEIERGFLPAAPHRDACGHCEYLAVCGPGEARRTARKNSAELEALAELRRMP
jgi:CRISPR/Cas system-associated exonuclease Cas4 (RecB family)